MTWMSLRLRIFFISILACLVVGLGSLYSFGSSWLRINRAYGVARLTNYLQNISFRIENQGKVDQVLESGEWAAIYGGQHKPIEWIVLPDNFSDGMVQILETEIQKVIQESQLPEGSFYIDHGTSLHSRYLAGFLRRTQSYQTIESSGEWIVVGTDAQDTLGHIARWSGPFVGIIMLAILVGLAMSYLLSKKTYQDYGRIAESLENIGTGRLENLRLPEKPDAETTALINSMQHMVRLLEIKNAKIAEVSKVADEDPMTGLPNYRAFAQFARDRLAEPARPGQDLVVCLLDIDFFKRVNDTYGHQVGDHVLRSLAKTIKGSLRTHVKPGRREDFFGRYGGEEFVGIFTDCNSNSAHVPALRLMNAIRNLNIDIPGKLSIDENPFQLKLTVSLGIAIFNPERHANLEAWINEADKALYHSKKTGRNRMSCLQPVLKTWT